MIHFMNIGLTNDGGYSAEDAQAMAKLPSKEAKIAYSKEKIHERLKERGIGQFELSISKTSKQYIRWNICLAKRRVIYQRERNTYG